MSLRGGISPKDHVVDFLHLLLLFGASATQNPLLRRSLLDEALGPLRMGEALFRYIRGHISQRRQAIIMKGLVLSSCEEILEGMRIEVGRAVICLKVWIAV